MYDLKNDGYNVPQTSNLHFTSPALLRKKKSERERPRFYIIETSIENPWKMLKDLILNRMMWRRCILRL